MPDVAAISGAVSTLVAQKKTTQSSTSFADILSEKTTVKPPCMAQFMAMTGCDAATASKALYSYGNWQDYLGNQEVPDVVTAQLQLQDEEKDGSRISTSSGYGARNDFQSPTVVEPTIPGKVVPVFNDENGSVTGVGFVGANGTKYTTATLTDRADIEEKVDGFKVGRKALDNFAKLVGGDSWSSLDLNSLYTNIQKEGGFRKSNGSSNIWNDL